MLTSAIPIVIGCGGMTGGETPKTDAQVQTESKVQALMKEGKSFSEIRSIMRGDPISKKGAKKTSRKR